ncbi:MAG: M67 family metallopeptidase [Actinomycetota bacterium]
MELAPQAVAAMLAHADYCRPEECCGLLAGDRDGRVRFVYPLTNAQHSAVAYTIEPVEHFRAWQHANRSGWEMIGAFHSHPDGPLYPSATDLALAAEPDWVYVIVAASQLAGFRIVGRRAETVRLTHLRQR